MTGKQKQRASNVIARQSCRWCWWWLVLVGRSVDLMATDGAIGLWGNRTLERASDYFVIAAAVAVNAALTVDALLTTNGVHWTGDNCNSNNDCRVVGKAPNTQRDKVRIIGGRMGDKGGRWWQQRNRNRKMHQNYEVEIRKAVSTDRKKAQSPLALFGVRLFGWVTAAWGTQGLMDVWKTLKRRSVNISAH